MERVAIIGASMTQFGQREGEWIQDLLAEAGIECLEDAGVDASDVEHLYVSNMTSGEFEGQTGVMNALVHDIGAIPAYSSASTRRVRAAVRGSTPLGSRSKAGPAT